MRFSSVLRDFILFLIELSLPTSGFFSALCNFFEVRLFFLKIKSLSRRVKFQPVRKDLSSLVTEQGSPGMIEKLWLWREVFSSGVG